MNEVSRDFVSEEPRKFHFRIGHELASSLTGFVVGAVVASLVWYVGIWYTKQIEKIPSQTIPAVPVAPLH